MKFIIKTIFLFILIHVSLGVSSPTHFDLSKYTHQEGLTASLSNEKLTVIWHGEETQILKLIFAVENEIPVIKTLAVSYDSGECHMIASNFISEFRVVSGVRRVTQQQTEYYEKKGIPLTKEILNEIKWDAFWDAPLYIDDKPPLSHVGSIPAAEAYLNHPGMPRKPEEVVRATASYHVKKCEVRTNGARLEIIFPGVEAGIFKGYLQFDIYKGSNLMRQMFVAKTEHPSAAYKYDAGLAGLSIQSESQLLWRDLVNHWQNYQLGGPVNNKFSIVKSSNRLIAAEFDKGSITAFPPPHSFYWARESEENLGYSWYRKESDYFFAFGMRQAELEENPEFYHNFALYNARPGTWQQMPVFLYVSTGSGKDAIDQSLKFTHSDRFKAIPGHKVMGHHYHVGLVKRLNKTGSFDQRLNDVETMKGIGVDIFSVIDGARGPGRKDKGELYLKDLADYYEAARFQSDKAFLLMPSDENSTGGRRPFLGGHYDILPSKPIYWRPERKEGQPLAEAHPVYGTVYNLGEPADMMAMAESENVLISMPHPNTKRSTGYPEAIQDASHFLHPNYFSLGYRWGMGIDGSEKRLGEYRFLNLWNETNNWMAEKGLPPKYALAISEARSDYGERGKPPWDDAYGMSPVNYLKIDSVPSVEDMSSIINALKKGEYFITTGEILIHSFEINKKGIKQSVIADIEWTFPLEFLELVWGNGKETGREIISATDLPAFGRKEFIIPFQIKNKKWIRFAAWDVARNGALTQPVQLNP